MSVIIIKMTTEGFIRSLNNDIKKKTRGSLNSQFVPLDEWDEYNFIQEMKDNNNLKKDQTSFEDDLLSEHLGADKYLVVDRMISHMREIEISPYQKNKGTDKFTFQITRQADLISDLKMIMEYDDLELDIEDRFYLLESTIELEIGGSPITKFSLSSNLLLCLLRDKKVIEEQGIIKLPLLLFDSPKDDLFPLLCLDYHEVRIIIKLHPKIANKMRINLSLIGYVIGANNYSGDTRFGDALTSINKYNSGDKGLDEMRRVHAADYTNFLLQSNDYLLGTYLNFNLVVKFVMFRFKPKKASSIWDYLSCQPNLDAIRMSLNGLYPMEFGSDRILTVDFMGVRLYVLPLSPELADWNKVKQSLSEKDFKFTGINFSKVDTTKFDFVTDVPIEEFDTYITPINLNLNRISGGMNGNHYVN
jgi:hypothetical protein